MTINLEVHWGYRVLTHIHIVVIMVLPIGSMYAIYGDIYHQYTPNVSIYTIHGSYGLWFGECELSSKKLGLTRG